MDMLNKIWGKLWYGNCKKPQAAALDDMKDDKLLISYELSTTNRAYTSFKNAEEFILTYQNITDNKHYYEIILKNNSLYFDLDFKINEFNLKDTISNFIILLKSVYLLEFGRKLNDRHIFILSSSIDNKGSLHFIIKNDYVFRNPEETKLFINRVNDARDISKFGDMIDMSVYHEKRAFRLFHSSKFGSDRVLIPISSKGNKLKKFNPLNYIVSNTTDGNKFYYDTPIASEAIKPAKSTKPAKAIETTETTEATKLRDDNEMIKRAIELYSNRPSAEFHILENPIIKHLNNDVISITFKRLKSGHCSLCDRTHDRANTSNLKIFTEDNKIFERCFKSTKSAFIGNITEIKEPTDEEREKGTFIQEAIISSTKLSEWKLEQFIRTRFSFTKSTTIYDYTEKYCSNNLNIINSEATIIGQRASMGTGKTNAAALRAITRYNKKNDRYVLISFRISLAEQLANDKFSEDPELKCYNKIKGKITADKLVIQPESLHRYNLTIGDRDYLNDELIIDEVSQVRKQFTSSTFLKSANAYRSYQKFKYIVKNSKHIHLMDANLTAADIKWVQEIRKTDEEPVEIYWNKHKNLKDRDLIITNSEYDIIHQAINDLKEGKRVYIASNSSTNKIIAFSEMIKKLTEKKILCICSDTLGAKDVKAALKDPNNEWGNYDCIISSPSCLLYTSPSPRD